MLHKTFTISTNRIDAPHMLVQVYEDSVLVIFGRHGEDMYFEKAKDLTTVILPYARNAFLQDQAQRWMTSVDVLRDLRPLLASRLGASA